MNNQIIKKDNLITNFYCICKKKNKGNEKFKVVLPCCHIFHTNCLASQCKKCLICETKIKKILDEDKIFDNIKYKQIQNDILAVRTKNTGSINYLTLPSKMAHFTAFINYALLIKTKKELWSGLGYFLKLLNVKINIIDNTENKNIYIKDEQIKWKNITSKDKIVVISNHFNYLDIFVLNYLLRCGFIASEFMLSTSFGRLIVDLTDLLIFRRGVDTNMVEKIKKFLETRDKIVIFPEGIQKENDEAIMKFRTGAFYTDAIICPIVLKYKNYVNDGDLTQALLKLLTQSENVVEVHVLDLEYPPFDNEKIEKIREKMAKVGNFKLSRVSNK